MKYRHITITLLLQAAAWPTGNAMAQKLELVEGFEFATTDEDAAAGVIDMTDFANRPAFYENGDCNGLPSPCEEVAEGLYSIGTDAVFCTQFCDPGSRIGFRRNLAPGDFPDACPSGGHFKALTHTYGDPDHPGAVPPDRPLSELRVLVAAYGDGAFSDGATGTHLWINLVDCEGEVFEFINFSEEALYSKLWTFDLEMGQDIIRLSPDSLSNGEPVGDGLLTEIAAVEAFIQDVDNPPTTFGTWYIDDLRIGEPMVEKNVPAVSAWGMMIMLMATLIVGTILRRPTIKQA